MKKTFFLQLCALCFLSILLSMCTKVDVEDTGVSKTMSLRHNYMAITTKGNAPAEVEVRYSVLGRNGCNEVKTERLSTPCLIGGEEVQVTYDSIAGKHSGRTVFSQLVLKRDFQENGADFLSIKNLSSSVIEYAVIGNQPLTFHHPADLEGYHNFNHTGEVDKDKVVKESPTPVYHNGVPILYLLKPELCKVNHYYILLSVGTCKGGELTTVSSTYAKKIDINTTEHTIREIMDFYKEEYSRGHALFADYGDYDAKCPKYKGLARLDMKLYGEIQPYQLLRNSGEIWFINTSSGMRGVDIFKTAPPLTQQQASRKPYPERLSP
ncbi:hypothetical protein [Bacteroides pyogenes]|uniref:hypothetical protein n=1 Tax=Bacteroides pyogenes TaxID=310300 RepID=UPI002FDA4889